MLKKLIRRKRVRMFYLDHVEADGCLLFEQVRRMATIEFQDITAYYLRYDNTSGTSEHQITVRKRRRGLARA
jgi:hypothetical protein